MSFRIPRVAATLAISFLASSTTHAASVTFGAGAGSLAASAVFTTTASGFTLQLRNEALVDANAGNAVLTAIFFDIANPGGIVKATSAYGDFSKYDLGGIVYTKTNQNLGAEWAFRNDILVHKAQYGVSSTGYGDLFGVPHLIDPKAKNYSGPYSPNGMQFGILPESQTGGNGGLLGTPGSFYSRNPVTFQFTAPPSFNLSKISNVTFQYGTAPGEPWLPGPPNQGTPPVIVPTPAAVSGGLALLLAFAARRWRSHR
jgi:hypothetical protein